MVYIIMMYSQGEYSELAGFSGSSLMAKSVFTEPYASFLATIIAIRKAQRVTQVELAKRLGKPQQFVSRYELGIRRLDVVEFYAITKALDADPEQVFGEIIRAFPTLVII
jgi:DNA-binding transcriptional regulator YiaG